MIIVAIQQLKRKIMFKKLDTLTAIVLENSKLNKYLGISLLQS